MNKVLPLQPETTHRKAIANPIWRAPLTPVRAVVSVEKTGQQLTVVHVPTGTRWNCEILESASGVFASGDQVLVLPPEGGEPAIVLGRIVSHAIPVPDSKLSLEARESLTLTCGASSIEMRADGKVLIKGEDVTLRANGTQRIRAGTVSIN